MTRIKIGWVAIAMSLAAAVVAGASDIPRLGTIYYGRILGEFGNPVGPADGITVSAWKSGGSEAAAYDVGPFLGPSINYRLQIDVVAAGGGADGTSVPDGSTAQLRVRAGGAPKPVIGNTNLLVRSGAVTNRMFILGTDANGSGLPDEWEQFVLDALAALNINAGVTNLGDFNPGADYDGDGASNRDEFFGGTLPFLNTDYLRIEQYTLSAGVFRIRFMSNDGFFYEVQGTTNTIAGPWQVRQFGTNATLTAAGSLLEGSGNVQDLYFQTNALNEFLRLTVK